jgi:hypothetical protein
VVECATQHRHLIEDECNRQILSIEPYKGTNSLLCATTATTSPTTPQALLNPFVHRIWRQDYLWPGAFDHTDFLKRTANGIVGRWKAMHPNLIPRQPIQVRAVFRDRSHLCSRLAAVINETLGAEPLRGGDQHADTNLQVLLLPNAVLASFLDLRHSPWTYSPPHKWTQALRGNNRTSRAASKCIEALAQGIQGAIWKPSMVIDNASGRDRPLDGQIWLDLGASPGGISGCLHSLGARVIAVDRAPLAPLIRALPNLVFINEDAAQLEPLSIPRHTSGQPLSGLFSDLNGPFAVSCQAVARLGTLLRPGAPVVITLKLNSLADWRSAVTEAQRIIEGESSGLALRDVISSVESSAAGKA